MQLSGPDKDKSKPNLNDLDLNQRAAIVAFAAEHGRTWKTQLLEGWAKATQTGPLQQSRNEFGPAWLEKLTFPDSVKAGEAILSRKTPERFSSAVLPPPLPQEPARVGATLDIGGGQARSQETVLPPPAPSLEAPSGNIDFAKSAEENIKDIAAHLEQEYRLEGGVQVAFKSAADFRTDAFDLYHRMLDARNTNYTAEQHDADYEDHLDHMGHCDIQPPPAPQVQDANDFDRRERGRLSFSLTPRQSFWTRRLWEVSDFPENRQAWLGSDGGTRNRGLRMHNCGEYISALTSIGISETSRSPKMITVGPNPFPEYQ